MNEMYKLMRIVSICLMSVLLSFCGNNQRNQGKESNSSIEGTYYWQASDIPASHTIVIKRDHWSSTNVMYNEVTHDFGYIKGKSLYDSSGYLELARVSGSTIRYGGHTLRKEH